MKSAPTAARPRPFRRIWELLTARSNWLARSEPPPGIAWISSFPTPASPRLRPIEDHTIEDFDKLFATNVRSSFFLVQQLLPLLGEGSSIILVSSLAAKFVPGSTGQAGAPSIPAYAATKGAVDTLVKHWASALGPRGVRVNAVAPGVIATDMSNFTKTDAGRQLTLGMQALKRIGQAADVADVIAFLASDKARWITGVTLPVDGGSKL
jgi:NAD(P)-dependent dehydrogenase (short-subunit alcohol dehydrogenase family)